MDKYEDIRQMWKNYKIESTESLSKYLDNYRILFAYNSGKTENNEITYHDTKEVFENGKVINYTGSPRTIFETQNQKLCYEYLLDKIVAKKHLSIELIKEVHAILTYGTYDERRFIENNERPGEFKKHDYIAGRSEVSYPPETAEEALNILLDEINEYKNGDILTAAAYFHLKFEYAHPFADGNGRCGRTLMNYYLLINDEPPVIIYDEDKAMYYEALEKYDSDEEIGLMQDFLKGQTIKTWEKSLERENGILSKPQKKLDDMR